MPCCWLFSTISATCSNGSLNSVRRTTRRATSFFRDFLELLSSTYPKPRNVAYYADKLCLTPKYLSTVCREACGSTASEIINRYVVRDVQYLLRQRGKSIKEICNELEFPNLSFFGRYVKKHLGLSPKAYRSHEVEQSGDVLG